MVADRKMRAKIAMLASGPALSRIESDKGRISMRRIATAYKDPLNFAFKRKKGGVGLEWVGFANFAAHTALGFSMYDIISDGLGDRAASWASMKYVYFLFEFQFEPGEKWSISDFGADYLGAYLGERYGSFGLNHLTSLLY